MNTPSRRRRRSRIDRAYRSAALLDLLGAAPMPTIDDALAVEPITPVEPVATVVSSRYIEALPDEMTAVPLLADAAVTFQLTAQAAGQLYSNDTIIDEAFRWFREDHGFPYRTIPRFVMLQQVNALALTPEASLRQTPEAYLVAD